MSCNEITNKTILLGTLSPIYATKRHSAGLSLQTSSWQMYEISRWETDRLKSSSPIIGDELSTFNGRNAHY